MDSFLIEGGQPLNEEIEISGAKNAALPLMAAALLTDQPCVIRRIPNLSDVRFMGRILESLGAKVEFDGNSVHIHAGSIEAKGDYELIRKMRGSVCIMGPLLGRLGDARVALPGGCVIGARPIDLHLKGFGAFDASHTNSANCSVSGLGIKTRVSTANSKPQNTAEPKMYCNGSRRKRRLISF